MKIWSRKTSTDRKGNREQDKELQEDNMETKKRKSKSTNTNTKNSIKKTARKQEGTNKTKHATCTA